MTATTRSPAPLVVRAGTAERLAVLGVDVRFLCRAEDTGGAWSVMETRIPADAGPPPHDHAWDEAYFVVEGEVEFRFGDRTERVRGGDFVYAPGGTLHGFRGISASPARMLILDAPAHAEAFFRDVDREVRMLPGDLPKVPAIGARHGLRFASRG